MWTLAVLSLAAIGVGGYLYFAHDNNPIPAALRSQLTFSPFVLPKDTKEYTTTDYKFITAEDKVRTLSYSIHTTNGIISVQEQSQPLEFTEIAEYKDRFLNNMKQYDTVQTANGIIYLGRLALQDNKQVGIMIERGLLVFMRPDKELNAPQWRNLGDQLEIQKIVN
jgi:hypothetical protein